MTTGLAMVPSIASASTIQFVGSNGTLSASVTFATSGNNLIVTLTNTSNMDVMAPGDVLTGVFFDLSGTGALTRTTALLAPGSTVNGNGGATGANNSVGGEWAYASGLSGGAPAGQGISSSGLGLFGPGDVFPGSGNLQGPADPDGVQYGITSAGDNPATGNGGISGNGLIQNSVVFTLAMGNFNPNTFGVTHVTFQYGTALSETEVTGRTVQDVQPVPEPATLAMFGAGLVVAAAGLRKARR